MKRMNRGGRERGGEELEENNKERWGGTGYVTFLLTTVRMQIINLDTDGSLVLR